MTPLLSATLAYAAGVLAGLRWLPGQWHMAVLLVIAVAALWPRRRGSAGAGASAAGASAAGASAGRAELPAAVWAMNSAGGVRPADDHARRRVLVAFCAVGAIVGGVRAAAVETDCRSLLVDGDRITAQGVAAALPTEGVAVAFAARRVGIAADATSPAESAESVASGASGERAPVCGAVRLRVRASARHMPALELAARQGDVVMLAGRWISYPRRGGWPTPPIYAGSLVVDSVVVVPAGRAGGLTRFRVAQQARLRGLLPDRWGVAEALLLAQKSGLSQETRARWVAAGLVHLLAISGMHVGLIAAGVVAGAAAAGLPRRRGRRLALLITAAYVAFLGAPSAALRALLQAGLLLTSLEVQRPAEPFTLLATAALAILLLEPMALLDPGFQLSFAGMIGLMAWRRPVAELLPRRLPGYLRDGIAAGVSASALTTPIAALHFGQASWIGIIGSLVAVPLLAAAVGGLLLALIVAAATGNTSGPHTLAADVPLRLLEWVAELCARVPGGHGYMASSTVLALLAAVAAGIALRRLLHTHRAFTAEAATGAAPAADDLPPPSYASESALRRHEARRRAIRLRWAVTVAGAVVVVAWTPRLIALQDSALSIHAIDVGQGDALAIRTPRGRWILVDTGPRTPRSDAGRDRVVPFLLSQGARRIEALILTHPDADHIGGAAAVLDAFDVGLVIDPGLPAGKDIFIDLLAAARREGQRWIAARAGISFRIDGIDFTMLYPLPSSEASADANDQSVVFRLGYGGFAALFTGDAPASVEEQLVARHGDRLRAAVLKVGHHGSSTSTSEMLLNAARPEIALVSAGRRNRYGHPAPVVLRRLERHEVRVLRTDELGTITVRARRTGEVELLKR